MRQEEPAPQWRRLLELLDPIHDEARALARRLALSLADGDDLFQDALLRAFDRLATLRDETRFRAWFYAVLLSVHRSRCRRAFWRRFLSLDAKRAEGFEPVGEDGSQRAEEEVRARRIAQALATLPAVQREAVVLLELQDFSIEEIAELQGASVSAVKSRAARGRARLRRHYERLGFRARTTGPVRRRRRPVRRSPQRTEPSQARWQTTSPAKLQVSSIDFGLNPRQSSSRKETSNEQP
jgi:RNA polymerase sigma-70 factor (ECF subfamily)